MTTQMEEQFDAMMNEMPPEVTALTPPDALKEQKAEMMAGIPEQVDMMQMECPFPWSHNQAMMILMGHAMMKASGGKGGGKGGKGDY